MDRYNLPMEHSSLSHMVAIDSSVNAVSLFSRLISKTAHWTVRFEIHICFYCLHCFATDLLFVSEDYCVMRFDLLYKEFQQSNDLLWTGDVP